jgi:hypothetical protein
MELAIAVISLMWVIGILSLQRVDAITDEFTRALGYYLSLNEQGAINQDQLTLKSLMPKTSIVRFVEVLVAAGRRWDKIYLSKSLSFFKKERTIKRCLEWVLVLTTITVPAIYLIDFSSLNLPSFMTKDGATYIIFSLVALTSLGAEKLLSWLADAYYPLNVKEHSDN